MTLRSHLRSSGTTSAPTRLVHRLAVARDRRHAAELRRRAAWVEQARNTPTLQSWLDGDADADPADGRTGRTGGRTRTAVASRR